MSNDWKDFVNRFSPRVILPAPDSPSKLSQKLMKLSQPQHVSQRWMASEIKKLVPEAIELEKAPPLWGIAGIIIGILIAVGLFFLVASI